MPNPMLRHSSDFRYVDFTILEEGLSTLVDIADDRASSAAVRGAKANEPTAALKRALRVLVVDDAIIDRDLACLFVRAAGHEATSATGGADAVAEVIRTDFDVVLMDVSMPEVDGLAATRLIRATPGERGQLPILALTSQALSTQIQDCRAAGMNGHLAKPYEPAALLAALETAVGSMIEEEQFQRGFCLWAEGASRIQQT